MTKLTATLQSTSDPHLFIKNKIPNKHLKDAISTLASKKRTNSDRTSKSVNSSGNRFLVRAMKIYVTNLIDSTTKSPDTA